MNTSIPTTPPGYATLFPYFFLADAAGFCRFLVDGLAAREVGRSMDGDRIANARLAIGNTHVMVSEEGRGFTAMPASYYLYVADAPQAMDRAIAAGASALMPVADMPYGDRQGGVTDRWGNVWWLSQRLEPGSYDD